MNIENLKRATELNALMDACTAVRESLSKDGPLTINGIELPQDMKHNVLQVVNMNINKMHDEIRTL